MLAKIRKSLAGMGFVSEFARFAYFGLRTAAIPVMRPRISNRGPGFEFIDGWRYYFYHKRAKRNGSFSQHAQDALVLEMTGNLHEGRFIDIGCNDPIRFNNTALLEKNYGWSGISIDAQAQFAVPFQKTRSTPFVHACVGNIRKTVNFARVSGRDYAGLSGVLEHLDEQKVAGRSREVMPMQQRPLADIIEGYNLGNIDCLFVDVEGYEMLVLEGIDFDALHIANIVIENDVGFSGSNEIRHYLGERGYELRARVYGDDFFCRIKPTTD